MDNAAEAKMALKKALAFEHQRLEKEMKESQYEIETTLEKWRLRSKEIKELEESIKFKGAVRNAKLALSGKRAATELLKYGVSHPDARFLCR